MGLDCKSRPTARCRTSAGSRLGTAWCRTSARSGMEDSIGRGINWVKGTEYPSEQKWASVLSEHPLGRVWIANPDQRHAAEHPLGRVGRNEHPRGREIQTSGTAPNICWVRLGRASGTTQTSAGSRKT